MTMPNSNEFGQLRVVGCTLGLFIVLISQVTGSPCPVNYATVQSGSDRCYRTSTTPRSQNDAATDCKSDGGQLVTISSTNAQDVSTLANIIAASAGTGGSVAIEQIWIGLSKTETDWRWVAGKPGSQYIQPQGCYLLSSLPGSPFQQVYTVNQNILPSTCITQCTNMNYAYAAVSHQMSTINVECRCSNAFTANVSALVPCSWVCPADTTGTIYCGDNDVTSTEVLVFRLQNVASNLSVWFFNQPNNNIVSGQVFGTYQACLTLTSYSSRKWGDDTCYSTNFEPTGITPITQLYGFLCGYAVTQGMCSWYYESGHCFDITSRTSYTWFQAREQCIQRGGDLLSVDTLDFFNIITTQYLASYDFNLNRWWIGGSNELWRWSSGLEASSYTNWAANRPSDQTSQCVVLEQTTTTPWQWDDNINCGDGLPYICEANFLSTVAAPSTTTTTTVKGTPPAPASTTTTVTTTTTTATTTTTQTATASTIPSSSKSTMKVKSAYNNPNATTNWTASTTAILTTIASNSSLYAAIDELSDTPLTSANPGVIISIVFVGVVLLVSTIRLLLACCCDKNKGEDEVPIAAS